MRFRSILLAASVVFLSASCSKDDDGPPPPSSSYPKNVSVEYKVSSSSGLSTAGSIMYTNATGGSTSVSNSSLPFSKKIDITVNRYDNVALSVTHPNGGTLKLEILVNNVVVKSQEFSGNPVISGTVPYIFP
jgi:hypothetical protein